jgi:nitrate/nitrite transporter NarK
MRDGATGEQDAKSFPLAPLAATLAVQTLATGAAYSIPAVAPEVARHIGINPALVGVYISLVYGVGIVSALLSPGYVYRYGATRVSQAVLLATLAMLAAAALGTAAMIVLSAALLGLAYGATAPSSTHLLVPRTPKSQMNVVLSLRQIGVPLGGMLAGLAMPPLALALGWRTALIVQIIPALVLLAILEVARRTWDHPSPGPAPASVGLGAMARLLAGERPLQRLSFASFVYAGLQICFIAFMTTQLTTVVGLSLIQAGQILALYQLAGVVSRPIWGWLADHVMPARLLLAVQGAIMCVAAILAGRFSPDWPVALIALVCIAGGATASGYTGIAYAEYARLGGARRTEATGIGSACMFAGVMVLPAAMSGAVTLTGSYAYVYTAFGLLALAAGFGMVSGGADRRS